MTWDSENLTTAAQKCLGFGLSAQDVYRHASDQESSGLSVSASYTRAVAAIMEGLPNA
jgi:hypothetical protein